MCWLEDPLVGERIDAGVREGRRDHAQGLRVQIDGAALEVELQRFEKICALRERAVLPHEVAEGEVAIGRPALGQIDRVVETDSAVAGQSAPCFGHVVEPIRDLVAGMQQRART